MSHHQHLSTYLNDHLAGSVAALELLEHLEKAHPGTATAQFAAALRSDIETDRQELVSLMDRMRVRASAAQGSGVAGGKADRTQAAPGRPLGRLPALA
jgi:hypothetical protein